MDRNWISRILQMKNQLVLASVLMLVTAGQAWGQFGASLSGTVQDPSGGVISGATVTLTNAATQQVKTAVTGDTGAYSFSELAPAKYDLAVTASGFNGQKLTSVAVAAETPRTMDVTLSAGGATESVTVNADEAPVLQTADASIGSTIDAEMLQRLPVTGGDVYELLRTAPGITADSARSGSGDSVRLPNGAGPGQSNRGVFQTENQVQVSANGQGVGANNYMIDGVSVNSLGQAGAAVVTPNQESVSQLTVLSSSYSAEDGRNSGAQIKIVTRSGTNAVHGSGYFRYNEPGLNAYNRSPTLPGSPSAIPPVRISDKAKDYAASVGFPIIKDRLFLFGSYEGYKRKSNNFSNQYVETTQFDQAVLAQRPNSVTAAIIGSGGVAPRIVQVLTPTCQPYINAGLPCAIVAGGIDVGSSGTAARNGQYFFQNNCKNPGDPACKAGFAVGTGGFATGAGLDGIPDLQFAQLLVPSHTHANQFMGRADWTVSQKDQVAFSAFVTKLSDYGTSGAAGSRPQGDVPQKPINLAGTFIYIHTFTPTLLNELRGNATRFYDNQVQDGQGTVNYGIPYINIQNLPVNNVQFGANQAPTTPGIFAENTYEVRDAVTKSWGGHTLKVGGEYRIEQDNNNLGGNARPVYAFQGLFNFANNAPIFEGISANPVTGGAPNTARYLRAHTIGAFVQHDWKIKPTFTLNTGLRYEYFSPIHNKGQMLNLPVLGPAGSELSKATLTPHDNFFNPDYTGYSPKIGFAWVPSYYGGKVVLRGGAARAMNRLNFSIFDPSVEDGPGYFSYGLCCGTAQNDFASPFAAGQILYETGTSTSPASFAPNPALKTTIVNGLPVSIDPKTGIASPIQIEVYGSPARVKTPYAYLYSLEVQTQLAQDLVFTVGYQGSQGKHLPRLVQQDFLYDTTNSPFSRAFYAQTDSISKYNSLNAHVSKQMRHGFLVDMNYSWSKSMDQISNGNGANSLANQTDPANNKTEYGPSDFDTRNRITISGLWTIPGTKGDNQFLKVLTNGWQVNGIYTRHSGFPFTPVSYNSQSSPYVLHANTINPVRPYTYTGGFKPSCNNSDYITGADVRDARFVTSTPKGATYRPGIGRNSFQGPCYTDTDVSVAREQKFTVRDHTLTARFQANIFNALNQLNLSPFQNGNAGGSAQIAGDNPDAPGQTTRSGSNFGRATSADAGRSIEFFARINF